MSDIKNKVIEEIKKIYDPEIPVNIYRSEEHTSELQSQ